MARYFRDMLAQRQRNAQTLLCVGLDPLVEKIPKTMRWAKWWQRLFTMRIFPNFIRIFAHMAAVVDRTARYTSLFKPQVAHYEEVFLGTLGLYFLARYIRRCYPDIPVFLDCKRGDIDRTQRCYGNAWLGMFDFDGMNFSPYMGKSCMAALYDPKRPGKALVGLCYTSNLDAREVQDLHLENGKFLWEQIAESIRHWSEEIGCRHDVGLVMAAAYFLDKEKKVVYDKHLKRLRELHGDFFWLLIPGIGTQGGVIKATVEAAYYGPGSMAINSSSGVCFAEDPGVAASRTSEDILAAFSGRSIG